MRIAFCGRYLDVLWGGEIVEMRSSHMSECEYVRMKERTVDQHLNDQVSV